MGIRSRTALGVAIAMLVGGIVDRPVARARALDPAHRDSCLGLDRTLPGLLGRIDDVLIALPAVPPDEAAFLKSEHDAAMANESPPERVQLVMARPYYYIWSFREDLTKARDAIAEAIQEESANASPARRIYTISPFIATASRLRQDLNDVTSHFLPAPLNEQQEARLETGLDEIPDTISRYVGCYAWTLLAD